MRLETFDQEMMAEVVSYLQDNTLTKLHVTEFIPGDTLSDSTIRFMRRNFSTLRKLVIERLTIVDVEGLQYPQLTGLKKLELITGRGDLNTLLKVSPNLEELYLKNCLVYATQCMPTVKKLTINNGGSGVTVILGSFLKNFTSLEEISLNESRLMIGNEDCNVVLRNLKKLNMFSNRMSTATYNILKGNISKDIKLAECLENCMVNRKFLPRYNYNLEDEMCWQVRISKVLFSSPF